MRKSIFWWFMIRRLYFIKQPLLRINQSVLFATLISFDLGTSLRHNLPAILSQGFQEIISDMIAMAG